MLTLGKGHVGGLFDYFRGSRSVPIVKSFHFPFSVCSSEDFPKRFLKNRFNSFDIEHPMLVKSITVAESPGSARRCDKRPRVQALCVREGTGLRRASPAASPAHPPGLSSSRDHVPPLHPLAFGFLLTQEVTKGRLGASEGQVAISV